MLPLLLQGAGYGGIDTSINPSLCPAESLVLAYETPAAGLREGDTFGHQGTLVRLYIDWTYLYIQRYRDIDIDI